MVISKTSRNSKVPEKELTKKLIEILAKKDASPEEKKVQAIIKSALLSDNLLSFIKEVELASQGIGKIHAETVKVVEYARTIMKRRLELYMEGMTELN